MAFTGFLIPCQNVLMEDPQIPRLISSPKMLTQNLGHLGSIDSSPLCVTASYLFGSLVKRIQRQTRHPKPAIKSSKTAVDASLQW